jgi:hypothetical protein
MKMNQALQNKMSQVRLSAPPELAGIVATLDEFLKFADDDDPILNSFGDAFGLIAKVGERVWEIQRRCDPDAIARFRRRSAATITGAIVLALVSMPDELLDPQLERLDNFVTSTNASIQRQREAAEVQERLYREAEIEAKARKMDPAMLVKEIEAGGAATLSVDSEARIIVAGAMHANGKLMISAARDRVIGYLRDRQRARERTEVI